MNEKSLAVFENYKIRRHYDEDTGKAEQRGWRMNQDTDCLNHDFQDLRIKEC